MYVNQTKKTPATGLAITVLICLYFVIGTYSLLLKATKSAQVLCF